ncbi:MAG: hypothetical protein EKK64_04850 [Neisseriaceae bacterium]|nr:MAG: hypothetical protein EKK64_04850 [Neisseriaceae bacterium]
MYSLIKLSTRKEWIRFGALHRGKDLPAVEWLDGQKEWCRNGKWHRDKDLPAIIGCPEPQGRTKQWYKNGERHRDNDLPAIEWSYGAKQWWRNNIEYKFVEYENGTKEWHDLLGNLHRNGDKPAVIYANEDKEWWYNGKRHRLDGPAVIYGGKQYWFENGEFINV